MRGRGEGCCECRRGDQSGRTRRGEGGRGEEGGERRKKTTYPAPKPTPISTPAIPTKCHTFNSTTALPKPLNHPSIPPLRLFSLPFSFPFSFFSPFSPSSPSDADADAPGAPYRPLRSSLSAVPGEVPVGERDRPLSAPDEERPSTVGADSEARAGEE